MHIPLGLFRYDGDGRGEKTGLNSKFSVSVNDISANLKAIEGPLESIGNGLKTFTNPLEAPINAMLDDTFIGEPAQWIDKQVGNMIDLGDKVWSLIGYRPSNPGLGKLIKNELGSNPAQVIDKLYYLAQGEDLGLHKSLLVVDKFIKTINRLAEFNPDANPFENLSFEYELSSNNTGNVAAKKNNARLNRNELTHDSIHLGSASSSIPQMDDEGGSHIKFPPFATKDNFKEFIKNLFLNPDKALTLVDIKLKKEIENQFSINSTPFGVTLGIQNGKVGLSVETAAEMKVKGSQLFNVVKSEQTPKAFIGDLIGEQTYWKLGDATKAKISTEFTPTIGLTIMDLGAIRGFCGTKGNCSWSSPLQCVRNLAIDACNSSINFLASNLYSLKADVGLKTKGNIQATLELKDKQDEIPLKDIYQAVSDKQFNIGFNGNLTLQPRLDAQYVIGTSRWEMDEVTLYPLPSSSRRQLKANKKIIAESIVNDNIINNNRTYKAGSIYNDKLTAKDGIIEVYNLSEGKNKIRGFNMAEGDLIRIDPEFNYRIQNSRNGIKISAKQSGSLLLESIDKREFAQIMPIIHDNDLVDTFYAF